MKLVLTGLLLLSGMATLRAQETPVISYSHIWSYLITNATPTGWNASNYPAATDWWIGQGVFAWPGDEEMPTPFAGIATLLQTNFNNNIVTSFYFRTTFVVTNQITSNLVLNVSAIIDDGAVFYLNGRELSPRIRMPAGTITHNTFANAGGEVLNRVDTFRISPVVGTITNFVRGTNVMAVEVHQDAAASSDVVFGLQVVPGFIDSVSITNQPFPATQTIEAGRRATFMVGALGSDVRYQWFTNGVAVPGAVFRTFTTAPMNIPTTTGILYSVIASNEVNSVRSTNAVLNVLPDQSGPNITNLLLQGVSGVTNRVRLDVDEGMLSFTVFPALTNPANYTITVLNATNGVTTNRLTITNVTSTTGTITLFTQERMDANTNYMICALQLPDSRTNVSPSCAAFDDIVRTNIFPLGSQWQFQNTTRDLSLDNWEAPNYADSADNGWGTGVGGFVNDPDGWQGCMDRVTVTSRGARTSYFRRKFTVTPQALSTNQPILVRITHATDDGAVFYINGQDIYRYNMPAAPAAVNYFTVATGTVGNANVCQVATVEVPRGIFRLGANANTMAVELHQQEGDLDDGNSDVAFDMALEFERRIPTPLPAPPVTNSRLTIAPGGTAGTILITWTGAPDFSLQEATAITGPWTGRPANVGNNGYQTTVTPGQQRFYRTFKP